MAEWDERNALVEMTAKVQSLEKQTETLESSADEMKKENESMKKKMAEMEEEKKKEGNDSDNDKDNDKDKKMEAAIKTAMEEEDPKKRMDAVKKAMEDHEKEKMAEDDDKDKMAETETKMKEQQATIDTLTKELTGPKITYLANVYKGTDIGETAFKELSASWGKMSMSDLDNEIARIQPLVNSDFAASVNTETKVPVSPGTGAIEYSGTAKDDILTKIDEKSGADLMNEGGPYN